MTDDRTMTRLAALLRQAEGTDNEHEAEVFMAAAQRLATTASIDLAVARAHGDQSQRRTTPLQRRIVIGEAGKRGLKTYVQLFSAIGHANDLSIDVVRGSTAVLAYGFESDIDAVQALYTSLVVQMVAASDAYLRSGQHRNETVETVVWRQRGPWRYQGVEHKPVSGITARLNFQTAFATRIGLRLKEARDETREAATVSQPGTAVALRDKDVAVRDFYRSTTEARGTWRPAASGYAEGARRAGDRAGRRAKLRPDREFGAPRGALDR